jgi:hypothetical protein
MERLGAGKAPGLKADKDRRRLDRRKGCARRLERGAESSVGGMYTPPAAREVSAKFRSD